MAMFHVRRVFEIKGKKLLVLAGSVVEGAVKPGMSVVVPMHSSPGIEAKIHSVEFMRHTEGEDVCLCMLCPESEQARFLGAFDVAGETLEVIESVES